MITKATETEPSVTTWPAIKITSGALCFHYNFKHISYTPSGYSEEGSLFCFESVPFVFGSGAMNGTSIV